MRGEVIKWHHKIKRSISKKIIIWIGVGASLAVIIPVCLAGAFTIRDIDFGYQQNNIQIKNNTNWIEKQKDYTIIIDKRLSTIDSRLLEDDKKFDKLDKDHDILTRIDQHVTDLQKSMEELKSK